jgi:hypothetical protein
MDVCCEVLRVDRTTGQGTEKYEAGDFIAAYPATQIGTWDGSEYIPNAVQPHHVYVFITGVPIDDISEFELQNAVEYAPGGEEDFVLSRVKKWGVQKTRVPPGLWTKFIGDQYLTATWAQAKDYIERKETGVLLTDSDLGPQP